MTDEADDCRGFTSWKLDVLDAMSVDVEVTDLDFRVAFRIMQHINSASRIAWPSVARLAAQLSKSPDRIMAATKRLQQAGWLVKSRKSQKAPNEYGFLTDRLNAVIDAMHQRVEIIGSEFDPANLQGQNERDLAKVPPADLAYLQCPDLADLQGKHLNQNYLHRTPSLKGSEDEGLATGPSPQNANSYALATGDDPHCPYPSPETQEQLEAMLSALIDGYHLSPAVVGFFRRQFMDGRLTPAMVEEQRRLAS